MGKYFHKNKIKANIPIYAAAVLLCLTLISTYFVSGLLARYATSGESSDNARVAKFSVEGDGTLLQQSIDADLVPGKKEEVTLSVQNDSEVTVKYTVIVTNKTNNMPLEFKLEKKNGSGSSSITPVTQGNTTTFTEERLAGSHTDEYTLCIEWPQEKNDAAYSGKVDYIVVTVTATQID